MRKWDWEREFVDEGDPGQHRTRALDTVVIFADDGVDDITLMCTDEQARQICDALNSQTCTVCSTVCRRNDK